MKDNNTLDKNTIKKVFMLISVIPHYTGVSGTAIEYKEVIVIDDLLEALDRLSKIDGGSRDG